MYGDKITDSMQKMINETTRRRKMQIDYNIKNNIIPTTIYKSVEEIFASTSIADVREKDVYKRDYSITKVTEPVLKYMTREQQEDLIKQMVEEMHNAAKDLEFERAASLRDEIERLRKNLKQL
jgi:excinuclease ABC subunit B